MHFDQARRIAQAWIEACEPRLEIDEARTVTRPYGWVFLFRPHPGEGGLTGGPAALLFDRINGDLKMFGTGDILELALAEYESTIPKARLTLAPEFPHLPGENRGYVSVIDPHGPIDITKLPSFVRKRKSR